MSLLSSLTSPSDDGDGGEDGEMILGTATPEASNEEEAPEDDEGTDHPLPPSDCTPSLEEVFHPKHRIVAAVVRWLRRQRRGELL